LRRINRFFYLLLATALQVVTAAGAHTVADPHFRISSQTLADALIRFSEQSGLQIVYDQEQLEGKRAPQVNGAMSAATALDKLLAGSGLRWSYVNPQTVAVQAAPPKTAPPPVAQRTRPRATEQHERVTTLGLIEVHGDPHRILPNAASSASFGFSKPLLQTPRSISSISEETIELFGLSAVEDLVRVVPGVYTTTRYGIQGSVDVRNVPADTFFRGMKRLNLQGHGRSVLAAMDTIEVIRGPPSPIDGMGRIGGFINVVPKSGRARVGGYLPEEQGFGQIVTGSYDRKEASFGLGGPISMLGRQGGYYTYALLEDSGSYTDNVPIRQKLLQTALSVDNLAGPFRLETGANYQLSGTSGALLNRVTQDMIDRGRYIRGEPLANLDLNGNGKIGYLEYATASPVRGRLSAGNQPLAQRWAWPRDANGNYLPLDQFPKVAGIPESLYNYLVAHPEADPTGRLRAQGIGGPLPTSGYVPIGFALDPRTVGYDMLDLRRAGAFEREIEAQFFVGFLDLIYDTDPAFTLKNQMFVDSMDQYKVSEQPSGGEQDVLVLADKLTATYRLQRVPRWMQFNSLGSLIFRNTRSSGRRYGGDFSSHRTDVMSGLGEMTANTTFVHSYDNAVLNNDGAPWTSDYETEFWEAGAGLLFDVDLFDKTNVLVGGRIDGSRARNTDRAGSFNATVGTSSSPGAYRTVADSASGWDRGTSWSASLSHEVAAHVRPYVTYGRSSLVLDNNNNSMDNDVIERGHIGAAQLMEVGIKASLWNDTLFLTTAVYEQSRTDGSLDDPSASLSTDITHTTTRGWETEVKWVPSQNLFVSLYALAQKTVFTLDTGANILVDARALGFADVLDAGGNVIYPAEAFLYGGRAFVALPAGMGRYEEKQGNPNTQVGLHTTYEFASGFGLTLSANYSSSVHSGRLRLVELPEAAIVDAGVFWEAANWRIKIDVNNVLDERYFRARTGDSLGDTHVQAMPSRRWQFTLKYTF
jgi:outer membrane receptor protein involved in Fe transport